MISYADIVLKLGAEIKAINPDMTLLMKGTVIPDISSVEEWITYDYLGNTRLPSPNTYKNETIDIQISVNVKHSENRIDRSFVRVYQLIQQYSDYFDGTSTCFGETSLSWIEPRHTVIDLHGIGAVGTIINEKSPQLKVLCGVIILTGILIQQK